MEDHVESIKQDMGCIEFYSFTYLIHFEYPVADHWKRRIDLKLDGFYEYPSGIKLVTLD
jgi:hypothetical protein